MSGHGLKDLVMRMSRHVGAKQKIMKKGKARTKPSLFSNVRGLDYFLAGTASATHFLTDDALAAPERALPSLLTALTSQAT